MDHCVLRRQISRINFNLVAIFCQLTYRMTPGDYNYCNLQANRWDIANEPVKRLRKTV